MNREDIIRMAKNSGLFVELVLERDLDWLEAFAKLVAQHEREACAKIVENEAWQYTSPVWAFEIVNDIRARGKA
jgi:hypothetical protein